MPAELTKTVAVRTSDCDASGHWRPSAILIEMQEMAEEHAASFGLSRVRLIEGGVVWVLYRQHISMHTYPRFGEEIRITTWPGPIEGPIFPRYFVLERADGTRVGEAVTSWILMDIHTRRPMRPSALPGQVPANLSRNAPLPLPGMLRVTDAAPLLERTVCYSDLDVNGHMNNTRYIDWICDALDLEKLTARRLGEFQINYISEALLGEALSLLSLPQEEALLIQGKRVSDGRVVFEASVTYGPEEA